MVDERRRIQQRLRWQLHQLDPAFVVLAKGLDRPVHLDRVARWLARRPAEVQVRVARELVVRCRSLTKTIVQLDRELEQRTAQTAPALLELPGCGAITAAKLLAEIGPIGRFQTDAQLARHSGVAPLQASSGRVQRHAPAAAGPAAAIAPATRLRCPSDSRTEHALPTETANRQGLDSANDAQRSVVRRPESVDEGGASARCHTSHCHVRRISVALPFILDGTRFLTTRAAREKRRSPPVLNLEREVA